MAATIYRRERRTEDVNIRDHEISVPPELLATMVQRIRDARWLESLPGVGWELGTNDAALRALCRRWVEGFDWRQHEARLNQYRNVLTQIDGTNVHAIDARSPAEDALPIVMLHGWPSTVSEFLAVLDPMTDPSSHGGSAEDAFEVIAVSLPGFGFSGPTAERGWSADRMANAVAELLRGLGIERYGVFGTDAGSYVAASLASIDQERVAGLYLHVGGVLLARAAQHDPELSQDPTEAEQRAFQALAAYDTIDGAYAQLNLTKPHSLAYALGDSPIGQAAWILEKFHEWTDPNAGDGVAGAVSLDDLLAIITTYWVTGTAGSAARFYAETALAMSRDGLPTVRVPMGCGAFPGDIVVPSRRWAQRRYPSLVHWTDMPKGGHFSALEVPDLLVEDLRTFFRPLR
jgi:epoxide hydrolase